MKQTRHTFAIGLFVLIGFALFVLGCVLFGGSDLFARKAYFETYFDASVQGLDVGGPVKFRGVKIGSVESITFAGATYGGRLPEGDEKQRHLRALSYIRVRCSVDLKKHADFSGERLERMVAHGLRTSLALQGITGVIYVNLDFPKDWRTLPQLEVPWQPETLYVPSVLSSTQQIMSAAEAIADQLPKAIDTLTALANDVGTAVREANVPALSQEFRQLAQTLNERATQLSDAIDRLNLGRLGERATSAADDLAATTRTLREALPRLTQSLDGTLGSTRQSLDRANETLAHANTLIAELTAATRDARQNTDPRDVGETLSALSRTAAALEALIGELREKPSRLIFDDPLE